MSVTGLVRRVHDLEFPIPLPVEALHDPKETYGNPAVEDLRRQYFARVDAARRAGDTLGGIVEVQATGICPGLGSHVQWDRRLDSRLAAAAMSIPSVKAFEIGDGVAAAGLAGGDFHDAVAVGEDGVASRTSNRAGGLEAGITNGEDLIARIYFKPIATLRKGLASIDMRTGQAQQSDYERSDVTVLPAAAVVAEAVMAWPLADAFLEKFGGDTMEELAAAHGRYMEQVHARRQGAKP